jgi:hypothetical protein
MPLTCRPWGIRCEEVGEALPINFVCGRGCARVEQLAAGVEPPEADTADTHHSPAEQSCWELGGHWPPFCSNGQADTVHQKRPQICPEPLRHTIFWGRAAADRQAGISSLKELQSGLGLQTPEPSIFRGNAGQYRIKASSNSILLCCAEESWRHTTGLCNFAS